MKTTRIMTAFALTALAAFTSCKKDYTCTCTTVIGTTSTEQSHTINNSGYADARLSCQNYQDQANIALPGGTTCRL